MKNPSTIFNLLCYSIFLGLFSLQPAMAQGISSSEHAYIIPPDDLINIEAAVSLTGFQSSLADYDPRFPKPQTRSKMHKAKSQNDSGDWVLGKLVAENEDIKVKVPSQDDSYVVTHNDNLQSRLLYSSVAYILHQSGKLDLDDVFIRPAVKSGGNRSYPKMTTSKTVAKNVMKNFSSKYTVEDVDTKLRSKMIIDTEADVKLGSDRLSIPR